MLPLGVTMTAERRLELIAWAEANDGIIVEDDDSDVQYEPHTPAIKSSAPERVVYVGSFSKSIGPGIRLGYLVLPPQLARAARAMMSIMSNGQPWLEQCALGEFIANGSFDRHRRKIRSHYPRRRDVLLESLGRLVPGSTFSGLGGGMHLHGGCRPECLMRSGCAKPVRRRVPASTASPEAPASQLTMFASGATYCSVATPP